MSEDKKQIFVVDDDESVCRALSVLLSTYGFRVETFISAADFFRAAPKNVPGCLLLDVHMQGLDGWETLKQLRKSGSSLLVIAMSADKNEKFHKRALRAGAVGYLQKPFNDQALVDLISQVVKKKN